MGSISTDWKVLSRERIFKNKLLEFWQDELELPDKTRLTYYVNRRNPFSIIIPTDGDNLYMVRQYRYPIDSVTLEFPMGYVEGKTPDEMAVIELSEETGISAREFIQIGTYWVGPGRTDQEAHVYLAKGLSFGEPHREKGEIMEVEKYPIDDIAGMIRKGVIRDGPTIVSYYYFKDYLAKNSV